MVQAVEVPKYTTLLDLVVESCPGKYPIIVQTVYTLDSYMISCTRPVISCDLIQNREYIIVGVESGFMVFVCGFTAKIVESHDLQVCDGSTL